MESPAVPPPITTTLWFLAALVTGDCVVAVAKDRTVRAAVAVRAARLQSIILLGSLWVWRWCRDGRGKVEVLNIVWIAVLGGMGSRDFYTVFRSLSRSPRDLFFSFDPRRARRMIYSPFSMINLYIERCGFGSLEYEFI